MPKKTIRFNINNEIQNKADSSLPSRELSNSKVSSQVMSRELDVVIDSLDEIYDMMVDDNSSGNNIHSSSYSESENLSAKTIQSIVTEGSPQNLTDGGTAGKTSSLMSSNYESEDLDVKQLTSKYQLENMSEKINHLQEQIKNKDIIISLLYNEKEALSKKLELLEINQNQMTEIGDQCKLIEEENSRIKKAVDDLLNNKKELEMKNDQLQKTLQLMRSLEEKRRDIQKNSITVWEKQMEELKRDSETKIGELSKYCLDHYHSSRKNFFSGYLNECNSTIEILTTLNSWLMDKTASTQNFIDLSKWKERLKLLQETLRDIENQRLEMTQNLESDFSLIEDSLLKNQKMPEIPIFSEKTAEVIYKALTEFYAMQCAKLQAMQEQSKTSSTSKTSAQPYDIHSKGSAVNDAETMKRARQRVPTVEPSRSATVSSTGPTSASKSSSTSSLASSVAPASQVVKVGKWKRMSPYPEKMKYYVVLDGYCPGIYHTREEYEEEISGYYDYRAKIFDEWEDARDYMREHDRLRWDCILRGAKGGYEHDIHGRVIVWIAGFCTDRCEKAAGIGIWFGRRHPKNKSEPVDGYASINNAEIQAATVAIHEAYTSQIDALVIRTESEYLMEIPSKHLSTSKKNQWLRSTDANEESLKELDKALNLLDHRVYWEWGYSPEEEGMEVAIDLAKSGAEDHKYSDYSDDYYYDDDY